MRQRILPALLAIMVVATCLWVFATHRSALFGVIRSAGAWGPVLYLVCYVVLTAAFVPAGPLTLLGGALFGVVEGAALAFSGAMLASWVAFLASRYLARHAVLARVEQSPRLSKVVTAVSDQGRRVVFLLRVSPVIPFSLINIASGITTIRFIDFAIAGVGMIPVSVLYAYYGTALGELAALSGPGHPADAAHYVLLGAGLVATLVVTVIVGRIARRALTV
jgi:uncharacterized membrane protein YdjX (TVP38/TMEM64 family)